MKIAVVQHRIRATLSEDADALVGSVLDACAAGARVVVCPWIPSIVHAQEDVRADVLQRLAACEEGTTLLAAFRAPAQAASVRVKQTPLGPTALMLGDECLIAGSYAAAEEAGALAWIWRPLSESDLQAEAVLERAIEASASYVGLVMIAESTGAEPGEVGHGGSAVLYLGDVAAEAAGSDEIVYAEIDVPVDLPEIREPLSSLSPILEQRIAVHEGRKAQVGYLADMS